MPAIDREWVVKKTLFVLAMMSVLGILLIIALVTRESIPSIVKAGPFNMLFGSTWDPARGPYGMLVFELGTLATTLGGLIIGVPLALGTALFLTQMAPRRIGSVVSRGVELLAGIPSIVIGWLGFTLMVPWIAKLTRTAGTGILAASIILGIMVIPTMAVIASDALEAVPASYRHASIGLGATRWQTIRHVTLPAAKSGILVAVILGMGRAMGETMAVALVIGPASVFPKSLTSPTHTLTTKILTEMGEASGIHRSALFAMALLLLLISMAMIAAIKRSSRKKAYQR
jgi:phosphate transport system permease protein